jgi:uncharacterized protein GlcG (DUF336 family)
VSISIAVARRVLEVCKQRARELRSPVSIAIVDAGGHLVLFERMMAPYGWATGDMSIAKANTAVMFNQSTDAVAQWGVTIPGFASSVASMTEGKFIMASGGWPLRVDGVTIGGLGVSGGNAPGRDNEIARAGLAALENRPQQAPPNIAGVPPTPLISQSSAPQQPQVSFPQPAPAAPPVPAYSPASSIRESSAPNLNANANNANNTSNGSNDVASNAASDSQQEFSTSSTTHYLPSNNDDPYSAFRPPADAAKKPGEDRSGEQA